METFTSREVSKKQRVFRFFLLNISSFRTALLIFSMAAVLILGGYVVHAASYRMNVFISSGVSTGKVTTSPSGSPAMNCGNGASVCIADYPELASVTVQATPATGYAFNRWSASTPSPCNLSTSANCTFTISNDVSFSASFVILYYTLTAARAGSYGASSVASVPVGISCGSDCSEGYAYGTNVTLTANEASGYDFSSWTNCPSASGNTCTVNINANQTVTANFVDEPVYYTLTAMRAGSYGASSVTSSPAGISCGVDCSESYLYGTNVTLTANEASGYDFSSWTNCPSASGNTCTVNINANRTVTANFDVLYTVSVTNGGGGTITSSLAGISCGVDCSEGYVYGTNVTLTATPSSGYQFAGWSGCPSSSGNLCYINVNGPVNVTANFNAVYTLTVVHGGVYGSSSITSSPAGISCGVDCSEIYTYGTNIVLTATPASGYVFVNWNNCPSVSGNRCTINGFNASRTVTANFDVASCQTTVTPSATTTGTWQVGCAATHPRTAGVHYAKFFTFNVAATSTVIIRLFSSVDDYLHLLSGSTPSGSIIETNDDSGGGVPANDSLINRSLPPGTYTAEATTFVAGVTGNFSISIVVIPTSFTVTATNDAASSGRILDTYYGFSRINCGDGGSICSFFYTKNNTSVMVASSTPGSWFRYWSATGSAAACDTSSLTTCSFTVTSDTNVTANYGHVLTLMKTGLGAFSSGVVSTPVTGFSDGINCLSGCGFDTGKYDSGRSVTLTATPASGYYLGWTGCTSATGTTCTVSMTSPKTVTASFSTIQYNVTVNKAGAAAAGSTVTSNPSGITCGSTCTYAYASSSTVQLTANPAPGNGVTWSGCTSTSGRICTVFVNSAKNVTATFDTQVLSGDLTGWGWSDQGHAGWMSFNCRNLGECGTASYGLQFVGSSLRGYVWGGHVGWIYFPSSQADGDATIDLSSCPEAPCTPPVVNVTTGAVTGWARALNGGSGHYTGWIKLSGVNHPSPNMSGAGGVTYNNTTGTLVGYAWGGNVIGWIDFMGVSPENATIPICDFNISTLNSSVSINPGDTVNNTVSLNFVSSGGPPSTYYCDKNVDLWPGNIQYDTALFACGSAPGYEAPTTRGSVDTWTECARYDNPMCFNWTVSQWIDAEAMSYACGAGNYTKLSSNSFKCNNTLSCEADLSIIAIAQGPNQSDPDVKDTQYGARTFIPTSLTEATTTSALSIVSLLATPVGQYTVLVQGDNSVGLKKSTSFALNVDTQIPQCIDSVGWVETDKILCSGDSAGLTSSVTKTLVGTCGAPKCQYQCNPATSVPDNPVSPTQCLPKPQITIKAAPTAMVSGCVDGSAYKTGTSDSVDIYSRARILWTGANVQSCVGVSSSGDSALPGSTWMSSKVVDTASRCYTTQPLLFDQAIRSTSTCNGAQACYQFALQCDDLSGFQAPLATVIIPLSGIGGVSCKPYDNPEGNGAPLRSIKVGQPMYWVASTTPDVPLFGGGSFGFTWTGSDELSGSGTMGTCGTYECNHIRYVYKSLGGKTARVRISYGTSTATVECSAIANMTINSIFEEF